MKYITSIETDAVQLDVYECDCGFHLGLDATYLDQVGGVRIKCPSCKNGSTIGEHDPEECGCKYKGLNMWSCGHVDQEVTNGNNK